MKETFLFFKRNDQGTAPGMERYGFKHGDLVDVCQCEKKHVSKRVKEAFLAVRVDNSKAKKYKNLTRTRGNVDLFTRSYGIRQRRLSEKAMERFSADIHTGKELPILDGNVLSDLDFVPAIDRPILYRDVRAIAQGNATIGAGGAAPNYLTWDLFGADVVNQTGNLTATEVANNANGGTITLVHLLNGFDLRLLTTPAPLGDPTAGILTTINHNSYMWIFAMTGPGNVYHSLGNIRRDVAAAAATRGVFVLNAVPVAFNLYFCENLVNLNNNGGALMRSSDAGPVIYAFNNNVWDGAVGIEIDGGDGNANSIYSNMNFYNLSTKSIDMNNNAGTLRNNAVFGGVAEFQQILSADGYNNFGQDATGADGNWNIGVGNQINQVAANGWQSLVDTNTNFLDITSGGIFDSAGVANDAALGRALCIRGRTVPGPNGTSVGAAEVPTPVVAGFVRQSHIANYIGNAIM